MKLTPNLFGIDAEQVAQRLYNGHCSELEVQTVTPTLASIDSQEFKVEAVKLVTERGVSIAQAARDLDVHEWVKETGKDPEHAFPVKV